MKKAKIMFASLSVLALVGGALAFKAKNFHSVVYCTTGSGQGAIAGGPFCPVFLQSTYSTFPLAVSYCTIVINTPCSVAAQAPVSQP